MQMARVMPTLINLTIQGFLKIIQKDLLMQNTSISTILPQNIAYTSRGHAWLFLLYYLLKYNDQWPPDEDQVSDKA